MKPIVKEERAKPFRLVKYFTFSSLVVIFLGSLTLSRLNTHLARTMQKKKSREYAKVLIENLNHQILVQFAIPMYFRYGKIRLGDEVQSERLDKVVRNALHSFKVDMINCNWFLCSKAQIIWIRLICLNDYFIIVLLGTYVNSTT